MKPVFFAVAALAGLAAAPASAAVIVANLDAGLMVPLQLNNVSIDVVSLGAGDTLDLTINFTNGPMVVNNGSALWIGLLANDAGGTFNTTATMFILGGSANMAGSVNGTQDNSFVHVGNYFSASQFQLAPGSMSFSGLRQTMTINSSDIAGLRQFDRAFFYFENGQVAVVPEPSSWAMLIAGFGLIGAVSRRRRIAAA